MTSSNAPLKFEQIPAPYEVYKGEFVKLGDVMGVTLAWSAIDEDVEIAIRGIFELKKVPSERWVIGEEIYWNRGTRLMTIDPIGNQLVGIAGKSSPRCSTEFGSVKLLDPTL